MTDLNIKIDGNLLYLTGYNLVDNNYFKLRDLSFFLWFSVDLYNPRQTIPINS